MGARTGKEFLADLKDEREIWVGNERVRDVVNHPALAGAARTLASVFDLQHEAVDECLMPDPETGEPINVSHMIPHSRADLERRHACLERIAEFTVGLMGRTPDYMNVTFAGLAGRADQWSVSGNDNGAANLVAYQKFLARKDISLTHTIVHPTIDKSLGDAVGPDNDVPLHKVADTDYGIIVRGARILATLAPFANEIAVYPGFPLKPDADAYALSFCIRMDTPGLRFICRDSCSTPDNIFDHPLSSRFDEQDAFAIFDNVEIPRERLFIDANLAAYNNMALNASWWANIMQQTMIRAQTKLDFAYGLAARMAEIINDLSPRTNQMLGEIWSYAELTRAAVRSSESESYEWGNGVWLPAYGPLKALRTSLPVWFPRVNEIIRLIGSHNLLATPTRAQLDDPRLRPLIDHYLRGAKGVSAEERARVFRLAWDFAGSALGGRNEQYERFYLASSSRNYEVAHQTAEQERPRRLLDRFLKEKL